MKKIKVIALVILIILGTFPIIWVFTPNLRNRLSQWQEEREMIGTYYFNFDESEVFFSVEDSIHFSDMELSLNQDRTFIFSKINPYIKDSIGTWKVEGWPGNRYCSFQYSNRKHQQGSSCCVDSTNQFLLNYPNQPDSFIRDQPKFGLLTFTKN